MRASRRGALHSHQRMTLGQPRDDNHCEERDPAVYEVFDEENSAVRPPRSRVIARIPPGVWQQSGACDFPGGARSLPGDYLIPEPLGAVNHAIAIARPARAVWPWLAQMGAGRAGWYAYDVIGNGGHPSAERILPHYQKIGVRLTMIQ